MSELIVSLVRIQANRAGIDSCTLRINGSGTCSNSTAMYDSSDILAGVQSCLFTRDGSSCALGPNNIYNTSVHQRKSAKTPARSGCGLSSSFSMVE
jgi:hypothetical protein